MLRSMNCRQEEGKVIGNEEIKSNIPETSATLLMIYGGHMTQQTIPSRGNKTPHFIELINSVGGVKYSHCSTHCISHRTCTDATAERSFHTRYKVLLSSVSACVRVSTLKHCATWKQIPKHVAGSAVLCQQVGWAPVLHCWVLFFRKELCFTLTVFLVTSAINVTLSSNLPSRNQFYCSRIGNAKTAFHSRSHTQCLKHYKQH